jgi:hypothetical protein
MRKKIRIDTENIMQCRWCQNEVLPIEPKIIVGLRDQNKKQRFYIYHRICYPDHPPTPSKVQPKNWRWS